MMNPVHIILTTCTSIFNDGTNSSCMIRDYSTLGGGIVDIKGIKGK